MTPCRHPPSGLSPVLTQHSSGLILHAASLLNPSRSCMLCGCCSWDSMLNVNEFTSLTFLPVQLATGNKSDNTNSHWSAIAVLLLADYGGGLWPQAVLCKGPMSGLTQGKAIRIDYAKRSSCILCLASVKFWCCSLWILKANLGYEKIMSIFLRQYTGMFWNFKCLVIC